MNTLSVHIAENDQRTAGEAALALAMSGYAVSNVACKPKELNVGLPQRDLSPRDFLQGIHRLGLVPDFSEIQVQEAITQEKGRVHELLQQQEFFHPRGEFPLPTEG